MPNGQELTSESGSGEDWNSFACDGEICNIDDVNEDGNPGTLSGAVALIAGSAVGGGVLAIPAATASAGVVPSLTFMTATWIFLCMQGLLLAEVTVATMKRTKKRSASILSLAKGTLGEGMGKFLAVLFVLFSNAVLIGQLSKGGTVLSSFLTDVASSGPIYSAAVFLVAFSVAALINKGGIKFADIANQALLFLLLAAFAALMGVGIVNMDMANVAHTDWTRSLSTVPTFLQVLNFANLLPIVCTYLGGNLKRIRTAVLLGSAIPLLVCMAWDVVALGLVPFKGGMGLLADPVNVLISTGSVWVSNLAIVFSMCAVYTTLIGTYFTLDEFFAETLTGGSKISAANNAKPSSSSAPAAANKEVDWILVSLILAPSTLVAAIAPQKVVMYTFCVLP
ncbi:hypothetical protein CYMTET_14061 [Cymbomonas tetramitiformis]|uniref:Tyrosine-specific transport protein n=1 Tax=Cymbomonas tetramitiformis TaxID=36881 RepID=A0AAE0GHE2_9CHLO|nr:hypothetical protein CYMTET_14061 [Cymbomonas tetramitiformis]